MSGKQDAEAFALTMARLAARWETILTDGDEFAPVGVSDAVVTYSEAIFDDGVGAYVLAECDALVTRMGAAFTEELRRELRKTGTIR